ncbi:MAG: endonuclease/exonuclease/phosphatase family protein, partial [Kangiellaceae bacterium]|nr:endonuclease/exonuclease/phosphatase family protein [Kangiellaceae bacterium]
RLVAVAFLCISINAVYIYPWYLSPNNVGSPSEEELVLLLANVHTQNREYQLLTSLVASRNPDIVVLQEVDYQWQDALSELTETYPYNYIVPRPDNFGIALLSKIPLQDIKEIDWGNVSLPSLLATFRFQQKTVTLFATHPLPPINKQYSQLRDAQLLSMMQQVADTKGPKIIMGDLNLTMWSKSYQIVDSPFLINARKGYGIMASWPSSFIPFGIPIDHILVSKDWYIDDFQVGSSINSDHRPLVARLKLSD